MCEPKYYLGVCERLENKEQSNWA